ncbi:MAG: hypothetical protein LBF90_02590 [Prevotellaceae bacterium]|jgi:hypothetical protein|nr:hypothetical protein [Prevotellaceae bacterium]
MEQLILLVNTLVDVIVGRFPCGAETLVTNAFLTLFGSGLAFALGFASRDPIPEGIYANIRRWRGGISDRMANIANRSRHVANRLRHVPRSAGQRQAGKRPPFRSFPDGKTPRPEIFCPLSGIHSSNVRDA